MAITYELREYFGKSKEAFTDHVLAIADRIDAEHKEALLSARNHGYELGCEDAYEAAYQDGENAILAVLDKRGNSDVDKTMAEHGWVRGPLDADGEMWHSGDMSDSNCGVIEGIAYENGRWLVSGHDTSAPWVPADSIRHHHVPTVEDVLRDMHAKLDEVTALYVGEAIDSDERDSDEARIFAEYAAKLRLRGDAE